MKTCAVCEKELPAAIDEFGDMRRPVCQSCWLGGVNQEKLAQDLIDDLKEEIRGYIVEMLWRDERSEGHDKVS